MAESYELFLSIEICLQRDLYAYKNQVSFLYKKINKIETKDLKLFFT